MRICFGEKKMGKLKELREQWEQMSYEDPKREEVEKEINRIEQWCIDKGVAGIIKLTVWNNKMNGGNNDYPWHTGFVKIRDMWMVGSLNGKRINYNSDKSIHNCEKCVKL